METSISQAVSKKDLVIPKWMLFLAGKLTPHYDRDVLLGDVRALRCKSRREYAWRTAELIGGVIKARMGEAFEIWLLVGEALSLYLAVCIPDVHAPFLPFAVLLTSLVALWRIRDAYAYPAEGSPLEMFLDLAFGLGLVIALEAFLTFNAPRLALPLPKVLFAVLATAWESCMRMLSRREDSKDPGLRKLKEKLIALWQMTILWFVACIPLCLTTLTAVPGSHMRDTILGALVPISMIPVVRLKKRNFESIWKRTWLTTRDPTIDDLEHALGVLIFWDKLSKFRSDLCAEAVYFSVLGFPLALAAWRWASWDAAAAQTDWLQVAVNFIAWILLAALWIHIKKLHEKLAGVIREEIRKRKLAAAI